MPNRKNNKVLLLIEPEQRISPLKLVLETEQYNVFSAATPTIAHQLISRYDVTAIILIDADAED